METLKFNRALAITVMIVVILASIPCGALRSVSSLAGKVERIYEDGSDRYGTVKSDLTKMADYAEQLYVITLANGCAAPGLESGIEALRSAAASPLTEEDVLTPLFSAASLSYNQLMAAGDAVSDAHRNSAISYFYEMDSVRARLQGNEEYAAAAAKYNRALSSFPASLFAGGRKAAITFGK